MADTALAFRVCAWATASMERDAIDALREGVRVRHAGDAVVESCQRIEAYGEAACDCDAPLRLHGTPAVNHLAEVAAGLHSAVLGEEQILGQVRAAFAESTGETRRLADIAIGSARELRRQTHFDSHAGHLLDRGLRVAGIEARGSLLVLGAGAMGRLVAARGVELGFESVTVAARRRPERAIPGTDWTPLGSVRRLNGVEVVAGCLGSGADAIDAPGLPVVRRLALDLGTPRNFEGGGWPELLTIADLLSDELGRPHARARRTALANTLRAIVERRVADAGERAESGVGAMRQRIEEIRRREVARTRRLHPDIAPDVVDAITNSLVNQILHGPSKRLRELGDVELERELVALFG